MGILLVVQGAASYPVRYHADTPPRTIHRLPSPKNTDELVQFLHQGLGLALARVQHILTDVDRWGLPRFPLTSRGTALRCSRLWEGLPCRL